MSVWCCIGCPPVGVSSPTCRGPGLEDPTAPGRGCHARNILLKNGWIGVTAGCFLFYLALLALYSKTPVGARGVCKFDCCCRTCGGRVQIAFFTERRTADNEWESARKVRGCERVGGTCVRYGCRETVRLQQPHRKLLFFSCICYGITASQEMYYAVEYSRWGNSHSTIHTYLNVDLRGWLSERAYELQVN